MSRYVVILAALLTVAVLAPPAHALSDDPPVEQLSPADGATVALAPNGIIVTYTCGLPGAR